MDSCTISSRWEPVCTNRLSNHGVHDLPQFGLGGGVQLLQRCDIIESSSADSLYGVEGGIFQREGEGASDFGQRNGDVVSEGGGVARSSSKVRIEFVLFQSARFQGVRWSLG